jgi:hypothetical protein
LDGQPKGKKGKREKRTAIGAQAAQSRTQTERKNEAEAEKDVETGNAVNDIFFPGVPDGVHALSRGHSR